MTDSDERRYDVVIIGAGIGGLAAAIRLKKMGIDNLLILERDKEVGGVWRDNTYPGCAVDTSILSYSLSVDPNPGWSRLFAPASELLAYLVGLSHRHDLRRHIRFGSRVEAMRYDDGQHAWDITTQDGGSFTANVVINAVGLLSRPSVPRLPGLDTFEGKAFHTARWDHTYDLKGKRVAVVGTGASSAQVVPQIAPQVDKLLVFQRSAPWVFPRDDREIGRLEGLVYRYAPYVLKLRRWRRFWQNDLVQYGFERNSKLVDTQRRAALAHLRRQIPDPELRAAATPDYAVGCKRRVMSDDYYPALSRANVELVTSPITEVRAHSVVDAQGVEHDVDTIIFGTGFAATDFLTGMKIIGRAGRDLSDVWASGVQTHKSMTVSGFPNLFFLNGPTTGIGAGSAAFVIECQLNYMAGAIEAMRNRRTAALDVRGPIQRSSDLRVQSRLARSVYASGCMGWYQQGPSGRIDTLYPGMLAGYWLRTRRFDARHYEALGG